MPILYHRGARRHGSIILVAMVAAAAITTTAGTTHAQTATPMKAVAVGGAAEAKMYVKPSDAELKKRLTPLQYQVTQHEGTEPPFHNEFWDNHEAGIYVDIVSGEPLFSSLDKYDSGTGWPSFTKPLEPTNISTKTDRQFGMVRTESSLGAWRFALGSHLRRRSAADQPAVLCMNSARQCGSFLWPSSRRKAMGSTRSCSRQLRESDSRLRNSTVFEHG